MGLGLEKVSDSYNFIKNTCVNSDSAQETNDEESIFRNYKSSADVSNEAGVIKPCNTAIGKLKDILSGLLTRNGKIDNTKQHGTGDCWFLSSLNALSYSEKGQKIIEDALNYTSEGIEVTFKNFSKNYETFDKTYTITNEELAAAKEAVTDSGALKYSTGDDDVLALELALEKAAADLDADKDLHVSGCSESVDADDIVNGNYPNFAMALLGFDVSDGNYKIRDSENLDKILDGYTFDYHDVHIDVEGYYENPDNFAGIYSSQNKDCVTDIYGNTVKFAAPHAYSIKSFSKEDNTITLVNPWDSSKDIVLSLDTMKEMLDNPDSSSQIQLLKYDK